VKGVAIALALSAGIAALPTGCGSGSSSGGGGVAGKKDAGTDGSGGTGGATGGAGGTDGATGGTGGGEQCPGATLCNGVCTQTDFDPNNCGTCGTVCPTGQLCSTGVCGITCVGGTTQCGDLCVDTQSSNANCGSCGNACATGQVCSNGVCGLTCVGGTTSCNGTCVNTANDPANCGACNTACPAGQLCSNSACGLTCTGGTTNCNGTCVSVQNDPANCGSCGIACPAGQVCSNGACNLQCSGGTTKCGTQCVNVQLDPANCGSCGNICPTGQVCANGTCGVNCGTGTQNCNGNCVNTSNDPANCGSCGNACAAGQYCSGGTCQTTGGCPAGLTLCNNVCTDTQTSAAHCGGCGIACPSGATCVAAVCQQCNSTTTDCDTDGWLTSEGDCCDKPGVCGSEPAKVNPGAIEVLGNGIDDNCNGKVDLFDPEDTLPCDTGLASNSATASDYAKALGICRVTQENPPTPQQKTWGLISAELFRADGTPLGYQNAKSIRSAFGQVTPSTTEGSAMVVLSSGIAADATQTNPGPNGGAPAGFNVSTSHTPSSNVNIQSCASPNCIDDWYATPNPPLKNANQLPAAPGCGTALGAAQAQDSIMLKLRLRAPTNAKAFSFNSYFLSAEYPEFVCTTFNDQLIALVDTPAGVPSPIPNPVDKNLMTFIDSNNQKWPIGINIAGGTNLFAVCDPAVSQPGICNDPQVNNQSCSLGAGNLTGTGFEKPTSGSCVLGGGTHWLTTAGNVISGEIVELRIVIWDVGDSAYDSTALLDGFEWLANATLPGTG
jgi:hypothetical protein